MYIAAWGAFVWLIAVVACLGLAVFVYATRPGRLQNRLLALALFIDGLNWLMLASRVASETAEVATASVLTQAFLLIGTAGAYAAFVGTLHSPLARPLAGPVARTAIAALTIAGMATVPLRSGWFMRDLLGPGPDPWRWDPAGREGIGMNALLVIHIGVLVLALAVAVHAWKRTSPGTPARSRAGWYVAAFSVRDGILLLDWIFHLVHLRLGLSPLQTLLGPVEMVAIPASILTFCGLVSYGMLKHQLFDIELKIKWSIRRGTLVAIFVGVFVIVAAVVEQWLQQYGILVGGVAVGVMLLALRPLERAADRLAEAAMPHVKDTDEYRLVKKRGVYRAAVESAMQDGTVTDRERDVLATLADELGLSAGEARALEREAIGGGAA